MAVWFTKFFISMLNRRHIRAKVMQVLYAQKSNATEADLTSQLNDSMQNMYNLYLLILSLLIKLRQRAVDHQKKSQRKYLKTEADINPNMRFIDNALLVNLDENKALKSKFKAHKIDHWQLDGEYVELIYKGLIQSDLYKSYMRSPEKSFNSDVTLTTEIFKQIIAPNKKLYDYFQDKSITWIDDFPVVNTFIVKLFKKFSSNSKTNFFTPSLFKDDSDENFGFELMKITLENCEIYNSKIISKTKNWDEERIAKIDFILLQMALCEFQEFPSIPIKVTINEYIEIAKEYSTPKSNVFINGVLDNIVKECKEEKSLNKKGRGLM